VKNLDREVLAYLAEDVLLFLLYDLAGPVMGIDDVVTDLELDVLGLDDDLQVLELLDLGCLRDGVLLGVKDGPAAGPLASCLQVTVHEVDLLQPAKALADVLRPDLTDAVDGLELRVRRGKDLVQPAELADDVLHHELG
jgi:hypothetical protein